MGDAGIIDLAGQLLGGATALSGLLLVFIGAVASGYDSYDAEHQPTVRDSYKRRARLALAGFFLALLAAVTALLGSVIAVKGLVIAAIVSLAISLVLVAIAACQMVGGIK